MKTTTKLFYFSCLLFLSILSKNLLASVPVCKPSMEAFSKKNYEGKKYIFGPGCPIQKHWNDEISSVKVTRDIVVRACEHSGYRGSCLYLMGNIHNLSDFRPTGISLDNKISSYSIEYQPHTKIKIKLIYDHGSSRSHMQYAVNSIRTIEHSLRSSGINASVDYISLSVSKKGAEKIQKSEDPLNQLKNVLNDELFRFITPSANGYYLYFPTKTPKASEGSSLIDAGWNGLAYLGNIPSSSIQNKAYHYLEDYRKGKYGIVNPDTASYVGPHEWGHMAGLNHQQKDAERRKYFVTHGSGYAKYGSGSAIRTIMSDRYTDLSGLLTIYNIFSSPEMKCSIVWAKNTNCGEKNKSDARGFLIDYTLNWLRQEDKIFAGPQEDKIFAGLQEDEISELMDAYVRQPVKNDWHLISIQMSSDGNLLWKNKAGVQWPLNLDNGYLVTSALSPYGSKKLEIIRDDDLTIHGIRYLDSIYLRRVARDPGKRDLIGNYKRNPVQNNWHKVSIIMKRNGELVWKNDAGVEWPLNFTGGQLRTSSSSPYGSNKLEINQSPEGKVESIKFLNALYTKER